MIENAPNEDRPVRQVVAGSATFAAAAPLLTCALLACFWASRRYQATSCS